LDLNPREEDFERFISDVANQKLALTQQEAGLGNSRSKTLLRPLFMYE
jgi:hypothetical protein